MTAQLVLTLVGIDKYYGYIPEVGDYPDKFEEYTVIDEDDEDGDELDWYLDEHFAMPVNKLCDSLLGYGDVDYLDAKKCKKLIPWLEENVKKESNAKVIDIYNKLHEFAKRAVDLNTGIIIEM